MQVEYLKETISESDLSLKRSHQEIQYVSQGAQAFATNHKPQNINTLGKFIDQRFPATKSLKNYRAQNGPIGHQNFQRQVWTDPFPLARYSSYLMIESM